MTEPFFLLFLCLTVRVWFRSFADISLLPQQEMNEASEHLYSLKPALYKNQIDLFLKYHNNTYGINSNFPPSMYNHYRNINPRTIN
jgi:hypothetical protein